MTTTRVRPDSAPTGDRRSTDERVLEAIARPGAMLEGLGTQLLFYVKVLAWVPRTIRRYSKETLRLLTVCHEPS